MSKKLVKLTEGDLHRIIKESVKRVLNESWFSGKLKVYHYTNPRNAESILKNGFLNSRIGGVGGGMYGPGVYFTLSPDPQIAMPYGGTIIECEVFSNNAIFFDLKLAQKFGNMSPYDVVDDIKEKLGDEAAKLFVSMTSDGKKSSFIALELRKRGLLDTKYDIVFNSYRNGQVYLARNVHSITPLRIISQ